MKLFLCGRLTFKENNPDDWCAWDHQTFWATDVHDAARAYSAWFRTGFKNPPVLQVIRVREIVPPVKSEMASSLGLYASRTYVDIRM